MFHLVHKALHGIVNGAKKLTDIASSTREDAH